jgi:hypothetical protein
MPGLPIARLKRRHQQKRQYPKDILMETIGFTVHDLRDNRKGILGVRQERRLKLMRWSWTGLVILALLMLPVFFAPLIEKILTSAISNESLLSMSFLIYLLIAGASLAFLWWTMRGVSRVNADLNMQTVAAVEGTIRMNTNRGQHYLVIGDAKFAIHPRTASVFAGGGVYRVYLAPHTRTLLAAERLQ